MEKVRFIYNPVSGTGEIKKKIDLIIEKFQRHGFQLVPHKLLGKSDMKRAFENFDKKDYYCIVASGGDGTVHDVVNAMMQNNIDLPLGIIPAGTSNDFARYLNLPRNLSELIEVITVRNNIESIDIGRVNDRYFINIVSGGILPSIAHAAKKDLKNSIGMFAYYFKALEQVPNIKPFNINIAADDKVISEKILMFLIMNTSTGGGFKIIPDAKIDDGELDICLIKNCSAPDFGALFIKLLRGEHIQDNKVMCLKARNIHINCTPKVETDIDGEKGHEFPLSIEVLPRALKIFK